MLAGRPMICHTMADVLAARLVGHVVVSTDGDAIAAAAESMSVPVVRRPSALASDTATVDAAVRHAVEKVDSDFGFWIGDFGLASANVASNDNRKSKIQN